MSKDEVFPNILFVYESNPEYTNYYLIPSDAEMSVNLRKAVIGLNGFIVNATDMPEDAKVWKHWAYVNAAITKERENLDAANAYEENRFFGMLNGFQIDEGAVFGEQTLIDLNGPLLLVRAGIIM
jgi:hypothetical protein